VIRVGSQGRKAGRGKEKNLSKKGAVRTRKVTEGGPSAEAHQEEKRIGEERTWCLGEREGMEKRGRGSSSRRGETPLTGTALKRRTQRANNAQSWERRKYGDGVPSEPL